MLKILSQNFKQVYLKKTFLQSNIVNILTVNVFSKKLVYSLKKKKGIGNLGHTMIYLNSHSFTSLVKVKNKSK